MYREMWIFLTYKLGLPILCWDMQHRWRKWGLLEVMTCKKHRKIFILHNFSWSRSKIVWSEWEFWPQFGNLSLLYKECTATLSQKSTVKNNKNIGIQNMAMRAKIWSLARSSGSALSSAGSQVTRVAASSPAINHVQSRQASGGKCIS